MPLYDLHKQNVLLTGHHHPSCTILPFFVSVQREKQSRSTERNGWSQSTLTLYMLYSPRWGRGVLCCSLRSPLMKSLAPGTEEECCTKARLCITTVDIRWQNIKKEWKNIFIYIWWILTKNISYCMIRFNLGWVKTDIHITHMYTVWVDGR